MRMTIALAVKVMIMISRHKRDEAVIAELFQFTFHLRARPEIDLICLI